MLLWVWKSEEGRKEEKREKKRTIIIKGYPQEEDWDPEGRFQRGQTKWWGEPFTGIKLYELWMALPAAGLISTSTIILLINNSGQNNDWMMNNKNEVPMLAKARGPVLIILSE